MGKKSENKKSYQKYKKVLAIYLTGIMVLSGFLGFAKIVETDGSGNYPAPKNGDWVITNNTYVGNETIILNGNLTVENGGSLTLRNVTLIMNCTEDGEFGIEVKDGGKLFILDFDNNPETKFDMSNITANDTEYEFKFLVKSGAVFEMRNSELSECGYVWETTGRAGLTIKTDNAVIDNSSFYNNKYGILLYKSSNNQITNNNVFNNDFGIYLRSSSNNNQIAKNTISNSKWYNIRVHSSTNNQITNNIVSNSKCGGISLYSSYNNQIINSTILESAYYDFYFEENSSIIVINTTFNKNKIYFDDEVSELIVKWYLSVKIFDKNHSTVPNASVRIQDNENGTYDENYTTDSEGFVKWLNLTEYNENKNDGKIYYTPYNITAEKDGNISSRKVELTKNKEIKIILKETNDWIITTTEIYENQVILLDRNLIIEKGGKLILKDVTLIMNCSYDGEYQIVVKDGGEFQVLGVKETITPPGKGDYDLIIGSYDGKLSYYKNNGTRKLPKWESQGTLKDVNGEEIDVGSTSAPAFADLDNDGDFDLTIGNSDGVLYYYENTDTASQPEWTVDNTMFSGIDVGYYSAPAFADLDNDGDFDLTIGEYYGTLYYYENTGSASQPEWTEDSSMFSGIDVGRKSAPAFADLDGDGDFDLTIGENDGDLYYYENTGTASQPEWTKDSSMFSGVEVERNSAPTFADLDGDGDLDLTIGVYDGELSYFENLGTASRPKWIDDSAMFYRVEVERYSAPTFADLDDDGDFDLAIGEYEGTLYYYENTGTASAPEWTENNSMFSGIDVGTKSAPAFTDLDGDGDFDLTIGNSDGDLYYYENTGTASQSEWTEDNTMFSGIDVGYYSAPAFADLNGDGDFDLTIGEFYGTLYYYENKGTAEEPEWTEDSSMFFGIDVGNKSAPTFEDLDGDKDFDLTIGNSDGDLYYYENTGTASQPEWIEDSSMFYGIDVGSSSTPTFADLDNDGDFDLTIGEKNGNLNYYENTGTASEPEWPESSMFYGIDIEWYTAPTFADLDADGIVIGDFDLVVGSSDGKLYYYENNGTAEKPNWESKGSLKDVNGEEIDVGLYSTPTFADLDNDKDYDLTIGKRLGELCYYENTGSTTQFEWTENNSMFFGIDVGMYSKPAFADLDGDLDFDLIIGNNDGILNYYENTGTARQPEWTENSTMFSFIDVGNKSAPTFADLDGDKDFDLTIGEEDGNLIFYENTGTAKQPEWTQNNTMFSSIDRERKSAPNFVDLDNDGDFDLTIGEQDGDLMYYKNTGTAKKPKWTEYNAMFFEIDVASYSAPAFADLDADGKGIGDFDLVIGSSDGKFYYYENNGTRELPKWEYLGKLKDMNGVEIDVGTWSTPAFADLDNDGDFDLTSGRQSGTLTYYENIGNKQVPEWQENSSVYSGVSSGGYSRPTLADLDGDGDIDLTIGRSGQKPAYYENTGDAYTPKWTENTSMYSEITSTHNKPWLADVDNDYDYDLILGETDGTLTYFENVGNEKNPSWSKNTSMFSGIDAGSYARPTFADLDGDGDKDLTIGAEDGTLKYFENVGTPKNPIWQENTSIYGSMDVGQGSVPILVDLDEGKSNGYKERIAPSIIRAKNKEFAFLFWINKNATFIMKDSELHNCGYESEENYKNAGLWINTDNATFERNLISNNYNAIIFEKSKNNTLINNTIKNSQNYDLILNNSNVTLLNTKFDKSKVKIENNSILLVKWFLDVKVVDVFGEPLEGINITVKDKNNIEIYKGKTNSKGYVRWIVCIEYEENETQRKYFTPHKIIGKSHTFSNKINVTMNQTKEVLLTPPPYGVKLICDKDEIVTNPGEEIEYLIEVINIGSNEDTINLSFEKIEGWEILLNKTNVTLSILEKAKIKLQVKPQIDAIIGKTYEINVTGKSENSTAFSYIILKAIIGQTDLKPIDLKFFRKDGIQVGDETEKCPIKNENTTINVTVENLGNTIASSLNLSFYDNNNLIGNSSIENIPSFGVSYAEIIWKTPYNGSHEIKIKVDPNNETFESNEDNNLYFESVSVKSNIPSKSYIFWVQVNYNWGSKARVIDAPVTVKNNKGEIIAINRTSMFTLGLGYEEDLTSGPVNEKLEDAFENNGYPISGSATINKIEDKKWELTDGGTIYVIEEEGQHLNVYNKAIKGKCRFELNETQYLEGDELEIIAKNPIINEGQPKEEILEGTYLNKTTIFAYSNDSNDNESEPIHFKLEPYGLIIGCHGDIYDKDTKIGSAAIYQINVKVAPDGNENEIVYFELLDLPNNWTVFISGEGVTYIDGKYMKTVGLDNQVFNLIVIPENPIRLEYVLKTELIATIESYNVPKYSMIFTTNVEKTEIELEIDDSEEAVEPGEKIKYEISIINHNGTNWDEVSLSFSGKNSNWAFLSKSKFRIEKGETEIVELIVEVPETAEYPESSIIEIYAVSKDGRVSNTISAITNVNYKYREIGLSLAGNESSGYQTHYNIKLRNYGDLEEYVTLEVSDNKWDAKLNNSNIFLKTGDTAFICLTIIHPLEVDDDWNEKNDISITAFFGKNSTELNIDNKPPFAYIRVDKKDLDSGKLTVDSTIIGDPSLCKDEDKKKLNYTWDFGDGTIFYIENPTHKYKRAGNYTINLTVIDDKGLIDFASSYKIRIYDVHPPTIIVSYPLNESINLEEEEIIKINTNEILILDASNSFDKDGDIVSYTWDFGDGIKEYGEIVNWNYSEPGDYEIILTVKDSSGKIKKLTIYVNVTQEPTTTGKETVNGEKEVEDWVFYLILLIVIILGVLIGLAFVKLKNVSRQVGVVDQSAVVLPEEVVRTEPIEPLKSTPIEEDVFPTEIAKENELEEEFERKREFPRKKEEKIDEQSLFEDESMVDEKEEIERPIVDEKEEIERPIVDEPVIKEEFEKEDKIPEKEVDKKKEKEDDDFWSEWEKDTEF